MSRRCRERDRHEFGDFNSLLALILIVTQFGRGRGNNHGHGGHDDEDNGLIDNNLLFIIALFLVVCGCCPFKRGC